MSKVSFEKVNERSQYQHIHFQRSEKILHSEVKSYFNPSSIVYIGPVKASIIFHAFTILSIIFIRPRNILSFVPPTLFHHFIVLGREDGTVGCQQQIFDIGRR